MSRPKPKVLLEFVDRKTYKSEQVLQADAIYAVFYKGAPFNLRSLETLRDYPGPKYKKIAFPSPGHAFNLAEKLNRLFKCNDFEVHRLTSGEPIKEGDGDD